VDLATRGSARKARDTVVREIPQRSAISLRGTGLDMLSLESAMRMNIYYLPICLNIKTNLNGLNPDLPGRVLLRETKFDGAGVADGYANFHFVEENLV
jgi:hypothetical protein